MTMVPSFNTSGALLTYELYSQSTPANAVYNAGQAQKSSGQIYVAVITGAVPATAVYIGGLAFTQDGQLYVTYDAVAATDIYIAGLRVSKDGVVRITDAPTPTTARPIPTWGYATTTGLLQITQNSGLLPGSNGNYFSSPDSVPVSLLGDLTIAVKLAMTDYTPSAIQEMFSKYAAAGHRSFLFDMQTSGQPRFVYTTDGTTGISSSSGVATGFTDGSVNWLAVSLDINDGGGNHVSKFWTSSNGISWTQLGTDQTVAGTTAIFDSDAPIATGALGDGTLALVGNIYRVLLYDGIPAAFGGAGGTLVADFNPGDALTGATSWTSRTTGEVWTVNGTASVTT